MTRPTRPDAKSPEGSPTTNTAFDKWLDRGLHDLYDGITNEPIPEALLRLILDDEKK